MYIPPSKRAMERAICHIGTPKGILLIITIGEKNGIKEAQNAICPLGCSITLTVIRNAIIIGSITGNVIL